jgi:membrane-associated phospholipid phosphatase
MGFGLFFFAWGLLVALSRVMTGVHYLLDALGGVAVGMVVGSIVTLLLL